MKTVIALNLMVFLFACKAKTPTTDPTSCDIPIVISQDIYDNGPDDNYTLDTIYIQDNCLTAVYWGGCDDYAMNLVATYSKSLPPIATYDVRLSFSDNSICEALRKNTISFDLSPLHENNNHTIQLHVKNSNSLLYTY
jgi:hypothetical protein